MADPQDYTLVRLDDNIGDNAVLAYDASRDTIVDSGLTGTLGSLQAESATVSVGMHSISSSGEQIAVLNQDSKVVYSAPWHVIDEVNPGGSFDRLYIGDLITITPPNEPNAVLENPVWFYNNPSNFILYRFTFRFPEARTNVQFRLRHATFDMWSEVRDISAGEYEVRFDVPITISPGLYTFSIAPYGDINLEPPIKVATDSTFPYPWHKVHLRPYKDVPLATQDWVETHVVDKMTGGAASADDLMLKSTYDTDKNGIVDLAENVEGATTAGNSKYYGTDAKGSEGFHDIPTVDSGHPEVSKLQTAIDTNTKGIADNKAAIAANADEITKHETAINAHGTQLSSNATSIATNDKNARVGITTARQALDETVQIRNNMPEQIKADVNHQAKTITVHLVSKSGNQDSALIDLSSWFTGGTTGGGGSPGVTHKIYYGFSQHPPMAEDEILRLSSTTTVDKLAGTEITITRQDTTPKNMYVWLPDTAGTIKGFTFSGFLSVWQSTAVNVAGIDGKFYVSPNKTSAQSVTFEVTV